MPGGQHVEIDDKAFRSSFKRALAEMQFGTSRDLARFGMLVQNAARTRCPVDTGRLRASIISKPGEDARGPFVRIGSDVAYSAPVEFGTSHMPAKPYLRPGLLEASSKWSEIMSQRKG